MPWHLLLVEVSSILGAILLQMKMRDHIRTCCCLKKTVGSKTERFELESKKKTKKKKKRKKKEKKSERKESRSLLFQRIFLFFRGSFLVLLFLLYYLSSLFSCSLFSVVRLILFLEF